MLKIVNIVGTGSGMSKKSLNVVRNYVYAMPYSDETVQQMNNAVRICNDTSERFHMQCLLADLLADRGEIQNAEQVIYSADTSIFEKHPKMALEYFSVIIGMYSEVGDYESVKRAYADGEVFFEKYGDKNVTTYMAFLCIRIPYNLAYGNYGEAERLAEFLLSVLSFSKNIPDVYQNYGKGQFMTLAAECCFKNNNISAAAKHCENALAILPEGTYPARKAAQLMEEIRSQNV